MTTKKEKSQDNTPAQKPDKENSSDEYVVTELIEGTPFRIARGSQGCFAVMGEHRITDIFKKESDLRKHMTTWNFEAIVISTIAHMTYEERQKINQLSKT